MQWDGEKISVISLGVGDPLTIEGAAINALKHVDVIIGAAHHFDVIETICNSCSDVEKILYPSPFNNLITILEKYKEKSIAILASGDALFYGVGNWLVRNIGQANLIFYPNVSSMQVAFHRVGLPWQDAVIHSVHGRPLNTLKCRLQNGLLLGIFTDETSNPVAIARLLTEQGFGESEMWVCESIGQDDEAVSYFVVKDFQQQKQSFAVLNVCVIKCVGHNDHVQGLPGIKDECFATGAEPGKGMISKREVRLSILSLMESHANEIAWDIGAGCGSVSIEWALQNKTGRIYAIENNQQRMHFLKINNQYFGTEINVKPVFGTAPECCGDLPDPDVIFVGGNAGNLFDLLDFSWSSLKQGGRLVASAFMQNSVQDLYDFADKHQQQKGELIKIQVSKTNSLSEIKQLRELNPITLLKVIKGIQ
ncbi:precorrin-6y C5,15-methyltransferase (decarboxylating) subunit CbiE [Beggiatoa alba]|nr:precorrin-6y C5,15-methyltransferase (decarboxylating) subunit CbiE [Beggiatoa alba]